MDFGCRAHVWHSTAVSLGLTSYVTGLGTEYGAEATFDGTAVQERRIRTEERIQEHVCLL